ncbi:MAG: LuxR C-terminal-related transcriptional regulator [Armatimonadota bacterium]|nr:LuxR C-terminal-related transcriptional regulator [Armatimonadota bacterium]MDR5703044.1 LuxR C-terminal-related transcriptional regulator [Armatimonadota bacterium]
MNGFIASQKCSACVVRSALEGLTTAIVLLNRHQRILFVNRTAQKVFGIGPRDLGKQLHHIPLDPALRAAWFQACTTPEPVTSLVHVTKPEDRVLRITVGHCRTPKGKFLGWALLACDVTDDRNVSVKLTTDLAVELLRYFQSERRSSLQEVLTPAEWRVLQLLGEGLSNNDISRQLGVSPNTLRTHLKSLYRKLQLSNRTALVAFAARVSPRAA